MNHKRHNYGPFNDQPGILQLYQETLISMRSLFLAHYDQLVSVWEGSPGYERRDFNWKKIHFVEQMLKLFILLLVSFLVLMSPYRLFTLGMSILSYNFDFAPEGWNLLYIQVTQWITTIVFASNSIINPILFNFLSTRFRLVIRSYWIFLGNF